jgi:hypothetical protein
LNQELHYATLGHLGPFLIIKKGQKFWCCGITKYQDKVSAAYLPGPKMTQTAVSSVCFSKRCTSPLATKSKSPEENFTRDTPRHTAAEHVDYTAKETENNLKGKCPSAV